MPTNIINLFINLTLWIMWGQRNDDQSYACECIWIGVLHSM